MFFEGNPPNRHLFFSNIGTTGCIADVINARLFIQFSAPQQFVSFRLTSDFIGAGAVPVLVNFFAAHNAAPGTQIQSMSFSFGDLPATVTFSSAAQTVMEIRISTRSAENTLDDLQFSDTVPVSLRDVAAAFDGSGSMAAQGKWQAMIEAGTLFYDLYKALGDPADTFGGVLFRASGTQAFGSIQITQRPAVGPLSTGVNLPSLFAADSPQGFTPIGEGVVAAGAMVQGGSNPGKAVVLLTDGINNRGRSIADAGASAELQDVTVHVIGLGSEAQIDPAAITQLAVDKDGLFRQTTNPAELGDFFAQVLSDILGKAEMAAVVGDQVEIASGTPKAVFLVAWDVGAAPIDFDLQAPDGTIFGFAAPPPGTTYHGAGGLSFHSFFVVNGTDLAGTWSFVNVPASARRLVLEDLSLRVHWSISPKLGLTGEPIVVRARITQDGQPYGGKAEIRARVSSPAGSTGEILAAGGKGFKKPVLQADPNVRSAVAAKGLQAFGLKELPDRQLASKTFKRTGTGMYELVFTSTELDGIYRFDLEAEGRTSKTAFHRRLSLFSVLVSAPADRAGTTRLFPVSKGVFRVEVTPLTRNKRPIGPFLGNWIQLNASQG
jgi:hypothetical protein